MSFLFRRRSSTRQLLDAIRVTVESLEQRQLFAAAGELDPSFGGAGRVEVPFPVQTDAGNPDFADRGVELKKVDSRNGFTVIAGEHATGSFEAGPTFDDRTLALARIDAAGQLDKTFDSDGTLYSELLKSVSDVYVQSDNKILVAGSTAPMSLDEGYALVRFNADGSLDTSFGGGDGIVEFDFTAASVRQQPDGRLLVGGNAQNAEGGFIFAAARLLSDGSLDAGYGDDGVVRITNETLNTAPPRIAVQPTDGKLLLIGNVTRTTTPTITGDALLLRLNTNGKPDASFSGNGRSFVDVTDFDSATQADVNDKGEIFVGLGGLNATTTPVAKLDASGKQGPAFAALDRNAMITDVRATFDGTDKVVLFGVLETAPGNQEMRSAIIRYNADGTLDTTFGGTGYVYTSNGDEATSGFFGDLQSDGKIIAGSAVLSPTGPYSVAVTRLLSAADDGTSPPASPPGTSPPASPPGTVPPASPPGTSPPPVTSPPPASPPGSPPPVGVGAGTYSGALVTNLPAGLIGQERIRGGKAVVAITNPTQNIVKGRTTIGLFVSADDTLDTDDPAVLTKNRNIKLKPGQTKNVTMKVKDLPVTEAGGYKLLAQITAPDQTQSVVPGDVTFPVAAPTIDLAGTVARNIEGTVAPGGRATVSVTVQNLGNVAARGPFSVSVFASGDAAASSDDVLLRLKAGRTNIKPEQSKTLRLPFRLPATLPPNTYFVVATVDSADQFIEPDEANNTGVAADPFTVG